MIRFHPDTLKEFENLKDTVFSSGQLSVGLATCSLEKEWSALHREMAGSVATSNGTTALELAAQSIARSHGRGIAIVPSMAPPMVGWAVESAGFSVKRADVDHRTGNLTLSSLRRAANGERVTMVVAVHNAGVVCGDIVGIGEWCKENRAGLLEDCSHAHLCAGSALHADAAAWSFYPTKVLASTEGGIASFRAEQSLGFARVYANQGKERGTGTFGEHGYNLRASELSACLMLAEVRTRELVVADRQLQADLYASKGLDLVQSVGSTFYKFTVLVPDGADLRSRLVGFGVGVAGSTYAPENMPVIASDWTCGAEKYSRSHVNLPYSRFDGRSTDRANAVAHVMLGK